MKKECMIKVGFPLQTHSSADEGFGGGGQYSSASWGFIDPFFHTKKME